MYVEWTSHIRDPEEKRRFQNQIVGARQVLERLHQIIDDKEKTLDRSEMSIEVYSSPNWAERQAHKNGNRESFAWLKKLVDLDQQKGTTIDR